MKMKNIEKLNKFSLTNTEKFDVMGGRGATWKVCTESTSTSTGGCDTTTEVTDDDNKLVSSHTIDVKCS
jgi:hypothetical protein